MIGLIDVDGKLPNLALMKISSYYKAQGEQLEEDMYRFRKLVELKVNPFIMIYNQKDDIKLKHFARWVNGRIYKVSSFDEYLPWIKAQEKLKQVEFAF